MAHICFPLLVTFCISMAHLTHQWSNIDTLVLVEVITLLFRFPWFLPNVPFLFQHLIQETIMQLVVLCFGPLLAVMVFHTFLVCLFVCFLMISTVLRSTGWVFRRVALGQHFSDVFLMIIVGPGVFQEEETEKKFLPQSIIGMAHTIKMVYHFDANADHQQDALLSVSSSGESQYHSPPARSGHLCYTSSTASL